MRDHYVVAHALLVLDLGLLFLVPKGDSTENVETLLFEGLLNVAV